MRKIVNRILRPLGVRVVSAAPRELIYQHQYAGGYDQYRSVQIQHNKRKLDTVWADERTLSVIAEDLKSHGLGATGICHGARNGYEVKWFRKRLGGEIIGTDISDTANDFDNMVTWDFHDVNPDWVGKFEFVYTNSLDQAMNPEEALATWADQLSEGGRIYIEHTMAHSTERAGEMDPFGAHPMVMPYLFFTWGRDRYALKDILEVEEKQNNKTRAWVFVLARD